MPSSNERHLCDCPPRPSYVEKNRTIFSPPYPVTTLHILGVQGSRDGSTRTGDCPRSRFGMVRVLQTGISRARNFRYDIYVCRTRRDIVIGLMTSLVCRPVRFSFCPPFSKTAGTTNGGVCLNASTRFRAGRSFRPSADGRRDVPQ